MTRRVLILMAVVALGSVGPVTADEPPQRVGPPRLPTLPAFPGFGAAEVGKLPVLNPQQRLEQLLGRGEEVDDAALAKVEVSEAEETKLGKQVLEAAKRQFEERGVKLLTRGKNVEYLSRIVELVRPHMKQAERYPQLHVYLINSEEAEAYSLPGGHVLFSRGLLDAAGCEAALVVTAGHELSHIDRGHLLRPARQWKLAQESFTSGQAAGPELLKQMMGHMLPLFQRPFGPEEELEADRDGMTWAYRLGYDPRAVQIVFDALEAEGNSGPADLPAFLRTHPASAERRENLKQTYLNLAAADPREALYVGRQNAKRRLTRQEQEFKE